MQTQSYFTFLCLSLNITRTGNERKKTTEMTKVLMGESIKMGSGMTRKRLE
jgi:hypothetical protein